MRRTVTSKLLASALTIAVALGLTACLPDYSMGPGLCDVKDPVGSIRIEPARLTLPVGGTALLTATLVRPDGETFLLCPPQTFWTSSNAAVASVLRGGVRGAKAGTTYIAARAGESADSLLVTVTEP